MHHRGTGLEELEAEWKGSDDEDMGSDSDGQDDEEESEEDDAEDELDNLEEEEDDTEAKEKRHAALTQAEKDELRRSATKFLGVAKDTTRSEEDVLSTPMPGENLRAFYERSSEQLTRTLASQS